MATSKSSVNANKLCGICGDNASIVNYGALSCPSCRTFFRRNGFNKNKVLPGCRFNNDCQITKQTRKSCTSCRFAKCLAIGMSPELIRKEDLNESKHKTSKSDRQKSAEYQSIVTMRNESSFNNELDSYKFYMNNADWNIISNIVHNFNKFSPVNRIRNMIQTMHSTSNDPFDMSRSLEIITSFSNALQSFISSSSDFQRLTSFEQRILFQRNTLGVFAIGGLYLMNESGIFDRPENEMSILPLYGYDIIEKKKIMCPQFDCDTILLKLLFLTLAFSSSCFTIYHNQNIDQESLILDTYRLFSSQNIYVELIWKYLINRYSYDESVQRLSKFIKQYLHILKISIEVYENNLLFRNLINQTIEQFSLANSQSDSSMSEN